MTYEDIKIFKLAQTTVDRTVLREWLDYLGATDFEVPSLASLSDAALLSAMAAKRCYKSFKPGLNPNVTKVRKDYSIYFENLFRSGHGSVLEHSSFTYAFEGVSRVFTHELVRHRVGTAISQESLRYVRIGKDVPFTEIGSIRKSPEWFPTSDHNKDNKKMETARGIIEDTLGNIRRSYRLLESLFELNDSSKPFSHKKLFTSLIRRILPIGISTGVVWTGNVRALRHILTVRCSEHAEEEICHVFSRVMASLSSDEPHLFGDFHLDENGFWRPKYLGV